MSMTVEERKAKQRDYYRGNRDRLLAYQNAYNAKFENKKRQKEYAQKPEVKARRKAIIMKHYAKKLSEFERELEVR